MLAIKATAVNGKLVTIEKLTKSMVERQTKVIEWQGVIINKKINNILIYSGTGDIMLIMKIFGIYLFK